MKSIHLFLFTILSCLLQLNLAKSQEKLLGVPVQAVKKNSKIDTLNQVAAVSHLKARLKISELEARKVTKILDEYKINANNLISSEKNLDQRRLKLDALIKNKNQALRLVLPEDKVKKFVPTSELVTP